MTRAPLFIEVALIALIGVLAWTVTDVAVEGTLAAAAFRGQTGDALTVQAAAHEARAWFVAGLGVLAAVRLATGWLRRGQDLPSPLLFPAALAASTLGLAVQLGYGNPFRADWPGPEFASGVAIGCAVAAAILLVPGDLPAMIARFHGPLAGAGLALLVALALFGTGPAGTDALVNLGPVQPMEAVKLAFVLALAVFLARRAPKLRYQRERAGFLRFPRPTLLLPAALALVGTWLFLVLLDDLGPTLILGAVFLGMFALVTRSLGWTALATLLLAAGVGLLAWRPELAGVATVETRVRMWVDPWLNGVRAGDQIALARWALAAGGWTGSGFGTAFPGGLPAGHTDLVYAHLVEEQGVVGGVMWLGLIGAIVANGVWVSMRARTPERVAIGAGLVLLLVAQTAVILGGTLGLIPLTGVVVPFLSYGKSGMAAFLGLIALLVRVAEDGARRADTDTLDELGRGAWEAGIASLALLSGLAAATAWLAAVDRDATSLRGVVTTLADGTPVLRHDRRIETIAQSIRRGAILDREGRALAASPVAGTRENPLGDALGTVLGPPEAGLLRPRWSLERQHDVTLRGYGAAPDAPAMWLGGVDGAERLLFAAPSAAEQAPWERGKAERLLASRGGDPASIRRLPLAAPDYTALLPLARLPLAARGPAVAALADAVDTRSVRVTIDAELQAAVAAAAKDYARRSKVGAAAVVVMSADTGEVLARAQWPDYDPSDTAAWRPKRLAADPKFMGIYGPWSDKTGAHGVWQAGSVFKVLTATLAATQGLATDPVRAEGATCLGGAGPTFRCDQVSEGRTSFTRPDWARPVHDFAEGGARGEVDLVGGLTRSSNVYFAQLALQLGPDAYLGARRRGVEFGNPGLLDEAETPWTGVGTAGSRRLALTGFGQGAASWNVTQAARVVATVANGGTYRRCPPDMGLGAPCEAIPLATDPTALAPVLAGMRGVMERGTGRSLPGVLGVRLYGKTGTADAPGTADEAPWGIRRGQATAPHSWFVAIAEPDEGPACGDARPGRYVVAAVVPHGGFGAQAAGPLAVEAVRALATQGYLRRAEPTP